MALFYPRHEKMSGDAFLCSELSGTGTEKLDFCLLRRMVRGKGKAIHSISFGSVYKFHGGGAHYQGKSGHIPHFGNPVGVEPKVFSVLRGIYNSV